MSLINDALRRAKQVQDQAPAPPPPPPLSPVEPLPPVLREVGVIIPVALTVIALLGLFLLWQVYQRNNLNNTASPVVHSSPRPASTAVDAEPLAKTALSAKVASTAAANPGSSAVNPSGAAPAGTASSTVVAPQSNPGTSNDRIAATVSTNNLAPASEKPAINAQVSAQPEPPKPAPLTLQGIVFNPRRPSVVINGKTLFVGDRIGQFRVAAIRPDSATLVGSGRTNLLSMEQ